MLCVIKDGMGVASLNWAWLPTWVGMNTQLVREIEEEVGPVLLGRPLTQENLKLAHDKVIDYLVSKFDLPGLFDYLDGLKYLPDNIGSLNA